MIAQTENDALVDKNNQLYKEFEAINTSFIVMSETLSVVDSFIYEIDNGREYQFEQPTALTSAKSYKGKTIDPLIKKLKQLIRMVYGKYARSESKTRRMGFEIETISDSVTDLRKQIEDVCISTLQIKIDNFDKLAEYLTQE